MPRLSTMLATLTLSALLPTAQAQQGANLTAGPVDDTTWTLFGSAQARNFTSGGYHDSLLDLTLPGSGDQAGAAFAPLALLLDVNQAFRFDFNGYITGGAAPNNLRGDGFTFTLATGPGIGGGGTDLGDGGSSWTSVAMAVDTFNFDDEPTSPSLQILAGGDVQPLASTETGLGDSIRDSNGPWFGSLAYTPSGLDDSAGTLLARIEHIELGSSSVQTAVDFHALGLAGAQHLLTHWCRIPLVRRMRSRDRTTQNFMGETLGECRDACRLPQAVARCRRGRLCARTSHDQHLPHRRRRLDHRLQWR
jgi:Bacterial lectin